MAGEWTGVLYPVVAEPPEGIPALIIPAAVFPPNLMHHKYRIEMRGKHRIANTAEYRFYRTLGAAPGEGDIAFDTNSTLPHTTSGVAWPDGRWFVAVQYFNGYVLSGFFPVGLNGEPYIILTIVSATSQTRAPDRPFGCSLILRPNGVIRIRAFYVQSNAAARADSWFITYTVDGTIPGHSGGGPGTTVTVTPMPTTGLAVLTYDLPAQGHGTTVWVRVQTSRSGTKSGP